MEQKLYNKILLNLLKGENHLRQMAKDLKLNHMTVKRALDYLVKENVLDVKEQGRNNVFSIKRTLEAKNFVLTAEIYKFNKFIKRHPELRQDVIKLGKLPERMIVIFGSYAKEAETKESDIDIYIETESNKAKQAAEKINRKFSVKIGAYDRNSILIKEIEKDHVIVKGFEKFYEQNKIFDKSEEGEKVKNS